MSRLSSLPFRLPSRSAGRAPVTRPTTPDVPALIVEDVTVRFAGLTALDGVGFTVAPGSVHALIGPNGAGKSTTFNVLSGIYGVSEGSVRFGEAELTALAPHRIAALGVARTFQNIVLTAGTVTDNLMLSRHTLTRAGFAATALRLPGAVREQRRHLERVREIGTFVGLGASLDTPVALLSYGDRKRVELARALCMEPRLLLLDEPVAGMNTAERVGMARTITDIRDALGISILIVEHDMGMVMRLADEVTVLDFGRRIGGGAPERVQRDPAVVRAYLGTAGDSADDGTAAEPASEETP
ncbi:ABC transporter ATP-binding protein [Streptomyces sp. Q6]|uniref:ABC transporter ATP-binding protein n=1 Tax=Streptomyces citrinus TaxID=3118173 RepID=A0ACD5A5C7_9ACTN